MPFREYLLSQKQIAWSSSRNSILWKQACQGNAASLSQDERQTCGPAEEGLEEQFEIKGPSQEQRSHGMSIVSTARRI